MYLHGGKREGGAGTMLVRKMGAWNGDTLGPLYIVGEYWAFFFFFFFFGQVVSIIQQGGGTTIHSVNAFPTSSFDHLDRPLTPNLGGVVMFSHGLKHS